MILRESYIRICKGDKCAAALLNDFEYWHNVKLAQADEELAKARDDPEYRPNVSCWVYKSSQDLMDDLLDMYKRDKVLAGVRLLESLGFVKIRTDSKNRFNRTRTFLFVPEAVNHALSCMNDNGGVENPVEKDFHSGRKIDSQGSKNRPSRSRKIDSLPYRDYSEITGGDAGVVDFSRQRRLPIECPACKGLRFRMGTDRDGRPITIPCECQQATG